MASSSSFIADFYDEKEQRLIDTYDGSNDIGIVRIHSICISYDTSSEVVLCELQSNDMSHNEYVDYRKMTYCVFEHRNGRTTNNPYIFSSSKDAVKEYLRKIGNSIFM